MKEKIHKYIHIIYNSWLKYKSHLKPDDFVLYILSNTFVATYLLCFDRYLIYFSKYNYALNNCIGLSLLIFSLIIGINLNANPSTIKYKRWFNILILFSVISYAATLILLYKMYTLAFGISSSVEYLGLFKICITRSVEENFQLIQILLIQNSYIQEFVDITLDDVYDIVTKNKGKSVENLYESLIYDKYYSVLVDAMNMAKDHEEQLKLKEKNTKYFHVLWDLADRVENLVSKHPYAFILTVMVIWIWGR